MCGISGIWDKQQQLASIANMNQIQRHRGPDDEGFVFINSQTGEWQSGSGVETHVGVNLVPQKSINKEQYDLALGNRRLAILDLTAAGHMPMSYADGKLWLTHNGEVYNYRELRWELEQLGYTFSSDTDTEVILAAYAHWGVDCLSHFNGMFAFALWDSSKRRLFCARDRFGIKPFYYHWSGSLLVFASEIKSLLQHPSVPRMPNDQTIFDYFARGLSDHGEETFFDGVLSLRPGHFLLADIPGEHITTHKWWQADINTSFEEVSGPSENEVYEQFADLLEDATRLRLRSDVPVGTCLSGGLDSSSVVCLANRLLMDERVIPDHLVGEHQKTFTARNREEEIDEYQFSHLIAQQTGAEENIVFPSGETLWQEIESFVWNMDEPVDSTSQYPQWNVMRLAKERGVTVLLDGQGGDEILAGYYAYFPPYLSQVRQQRGVLSSFKATWDVCRVGGAPVVNVLWQHINNRFPWRLRQVTNKIVPQRSTPGGGGSGLNQSQISREFMSRFWDRRWQPSGEVDSNGLVGVLYNDLTSTNLPKLLRYEDRNSMAFSLETRLPFLDYRLVEMVFSLPLNYRINQGWNKWLLRRSLSHILPQEVSWRRSKLGYPVPEFKWLMQGSNYIRGLLKEHDNEQLAAYIEPGVLRKIRELPDNELAATPGLWRIVNLIIWLDQFFNKSLERYARE